MAHTYKNSKVDLTSTDATALITVADGSTIIIKSIIICEDSNNDDSVSLTIVNGDATFQFLKDAFVGAKSTIQGMGGHNATLVLGESDILKATAATANRLHVITSYLEIT